MADLTMIGAALLPSLFLLVYFIRSDRFPEPWGGILGTFGFGVATVAPVLAIVVPLQNLLEPRVTDPFALAGVQAFILAALPEEALKLAVLLGFSRRLKAFDEPMDGLVYGVVASLGFATFENVLYVAGGGDGWLGIALVRAFSAVPGHAMLGAIMGFYIARAHFEPEAARGMIARALIVPVLLHGIYDFGLLATVNSGEAGWVLIGIAVLIVELVWTVRLHRRLRRAQQRRLVEESAAAMAAPHLGT
ncbi:PrsW family glutamic-type intramembrane protease [Zavarzinia compransoris]|uniref:PrsW family intramembrane metalloprotease n=1 Tax=Zavarzinia marina TaxID=2911065 RepID=UPI001F2FBD06|nr:PrsW family intramembrane metalloprotease [Zavarzinia marina]MCF4164467.1 PrsW family glutamic-type intramembrane protease [Zavarzinia marina]